MAKWCHENRQLFEELHRDDPKNQNLENGLFWALGQLIEFQLQFRDRQNIKKSVEERKRLVDELIRFNPKNQNLKIGLAETYGEMAILSNSEGDATKSEEFTQMRFQIAQELVRENPRNLIAKTNLANSYSQLGLMYHMQGYQVKAQDCYQNRYQIAEEIFASDSTNIDWEENFVASCSQLGGHIGRQGDPFGAAQIYQRAIPIVENLFRLDSTNIQREGDLVSWYARVSTQFLISKDSVKAFEFLQKKLPLDRDLARRYQGEQKSAIHLSQSLMTIGSLECHLGQSEKGILHLRESAKIHDSIYQVSGDPQQLYSAGAAFRYAISCSDIPSEKVFFAEGSKDRFYSAFQKDSIAFKSLSNSAGALIQSYGTLSWAYLFARKFKEADSIGKFAMAMADQRHHSSSAAWIEANIAHALIFQGKYSEAEAIYLRMKDGLGKEEVPYTQIFLNDFNQLEKAGITHPDVAKIRALLEKPMPQEGPSRVSPHEVHLP